MLKKLLPKSEFSRNVLTLMTGTTIAQAIPIAISPIITRIYTPEDFGVFALYISIVLLLSSIVAGRYELSILIPKNNEDAKHIVTFSILLSFFISILLFILIIIWADSIVNLLGNQAIKYWLYIIPLNLFFLSTINILYYWKNRNKQYNNLSKSTISRSLFQGSTNLTIGIFSNFSAGLIIGNFIGITVQFIYLIKTAIKDFKFFSFNKTRAILLMKRFINFPKLMIPSGFLENISAQMPVFLLSNFFGSSIVGLYSLSQRIVTIPIMLIGSSIGQVFRQQASDELSEHGTCRIIFMSTLKKLTLIATIPFIIFYFVAPYLFAFIFGENWEIAGEYAQIMTILFYLKFVTSPLSVMFIIAEKQKLDLYLQIYLVISVYLSFYIGYHIFDSVKVSLILFTSVYSLKYFFELFLSYKFTIMKIK